MLSEDNVTINGLWIGGPLSPMELLTLKSFITQGHRFLLWAYDDISTPLPAGVELCDASEILPRTTVFNYRGGPFPGSYAGFSDIFRYKLLYDRGGWWVDMDVTCLRPFAFPEEYVFRPHGLTGVVGNVMKTPAHAPIMKTCYEWASTYVNEENSDWLKPVRILGVQVTEYQLEQYVVPVHCFTSDCDDPVLLAKAPGPFKPTWYMIHWCNEWFRKKGGDKWNPKPGSAYHTLLSQHGIA